MEIGLGIGINTDNSRGGGEASFSNTLSTLFNGVDELAITAGDVPALNSITKMTWVLWFQYTTLSTNQGIISKWTYQSQGTWAIQSGNDDSGEIIVIVPSIIGGAGSNNQETTDANLVVDTWYNMVVVFDGSLSIPNRIKTYIDTNLKTQNVNGAPPTTLTNGTAPVRIGQFGGSLTRFLDGNVEEVGLFPEVAFNQLQVNETLSGGKPTDLTVHSQSASLNNYWRMGEGDTFPTITDVQGNNDLTMINMESGDFVLDVPCKVFYTTKEVIFDGGAGSNRVVFNGVYPSLNDDTVGSIEARIRMPDSTPATQSTVVSFGEATETDLIIELFVTTAGKLGARLDIFGGSCWTIETDDKVVIDGAKHTVGVNQDGVSPVLYFDGVAPDQTLVDEGDTTAWFDLSGDFEIAVIGAKVFGGVYSNFFNGRIDEFRQWVDSRTAGEWLTSHNGGVPATPDQNNLLVDMRMGEGDTFPTLVDAKSGFNGTMTNMVAGDIVNV